ncbi:MAG: cupin domain-containing protein [Fidelibacterota bacterium]
MGFIAPLIGARKMGYNLTSVPPGKRAFPHHHHHVNEEMFFILEGTGELRYGDDTYPVNKGDIIACPPGGKETAHQLINTGKMDLKYLAVSTKISPEIAGYPDSDKFAVLADQGQDAEGKPQTFRFIGRKGKSLNYWDGE